MLFNQMCDDFGISLGREGVAFLDQLFLQTEIVFDNAVMHHHDLAGAVAMRMRVFFRGAAVGRPAGVADAIGPVEWFEADGLFEIAQLSLCPPELQLVPVPGNGNASRIIAAIFEPSQALYDDWDNFLLPDIANNAAHD